MKQTLRQVFRSGKFVGGFCLFAAVLLVVILYPVFVPSPPLDVIGQGTFFPPGIYVNLYDAVRATPYYGLNTPDAAARRVTGQLNEKDRLAMKKWLLESGFGEGEIDIADTRKLLAQWAANYDPGRSLPGMTNAERNHYIRLNASLEGILSSEGLVLAAEKQASGGLETRGAIGQSDYVNIGRIANVRVLPLGTDNFGRDVLTELVKATAVSLLIGLIAGIIATVIGLALGLLAGYLGGLTDDAIMFFTNLFTVIPSFVLLILISFSIGQERRGAVLIAVVIGLTSWVWTARAVRSQVLSLRGRDHVNLSKLSGHSVPHIILRDILPYIASYVVMALILQISSGILAEAGLSILGLGPKTTEVPTLGLMMNWAMIYNAHLNGQWWAYVPVILAIALVSFSLNLMNTGLDQVFNPTLRD